MTITSGGVRNCCYNDGLVRFRYFVNHTVGKTVRVAPTDILGRVTTAMEQGVYCKGVPNTNNLLYKFFPKT